MIEALENFIWSICGDNEVLASDLHELILYLFPWQLTGSFYCWLFGHMYSSDNHAHCVVCGNPIEFITKPCISEPRILERLLTLINYLVYVK